MSVCLESLQKCVVYTSKLCIINNWTPFLVSEIPVLQAEFFIKFKSGLTWILFWRGCYFTLDRHLKLDDRSDVTSTTKCAKFGATLGFLITSAYNASWLVHSQSNLWREFTQRVLRFWRHGKSDQLSMGRRVQFSLLPFMLLSRGERELKPSLLPSGRTIDNMKYPSCVRVRAFPFDVYLYVCPPIWPYVKHGHQASEVLPRS